MAAKGRCCGWKCLAWFLSAFGYPTQTYRNSHAVSMAGQGPLQKQNGVKLSTPASQRNKGMEDIPLTTSACSFMLSMTYTGLCIHNHIHKQPETADTSYEALSAGLTEVDCKSSLVRRTQTLLRICFPVSCRCLKPSSPSFPLILSIMFTGILCCHCVNWSVFCFFVFVLYNQESTDTKNLNKFLATLTGELFISF